MDKEMILEKSRKENKMGDERTKFIKKGASSTGYVMGVIVYIIMEVILTYKIKVFDITPARIMMMSMIVGSSSYIFFSNLNKGDRKPMIFNGIIAIILIIMIVLHTYSFLVGA